MTIEQIRELPDPLLTYRKLVSIFEKYIKRYDKTDKFYMVGQNVAFDYGFLDKFFKNCGNQYLYAYIFYDKIDLVAATALFKLAGLLDLENVKLQTVAQKLGIEYKAHDAAADIETTRTIFYRYVDYMKKGNVQPFEAQI